MSQYPVESNEQLFQAVNYLLSGPGGLGQNFSGYSTYQTGYQTGNYRPPFTNTTGADLYVPPIALGVSEMLDGRTWKFAFASAQPSPPFVPGQPITVAGVVDFDSTPSKYSYSGIKSVLGSDTTYTGILPTTITGSGSGLEVDITLTATGAVAYSSSNTIIDRVSRGGNYAIGDTLLVLGTDLGGVSPGNDLILTIVQTNSYYDGDYSPIGVAECTTTYVIARTQSSYTVVAPGSGGDVYFYNTLRAGSNSFISTDANGKVVINGASDRVFLSAQVNNVISYIDASSTAFEYTVQISRLVGFITDDPVNPEYRFNPDGIVAKKTYNYTLTGSGDLDNIETIFTAIIDNPPLGYYWYILEVQYKNLDWDGTLPLPAFQVTASTLTQRGLSAQVVKQ